MTISLRAAINAKCKQCIYDPQSGLGTWRQQVGACTVVRCPIWEVRPLPATQPLVRRPMPNSLAEWRAKNGKVPPEAA